MPSRDRSAELAAVVWRRIFDFFMATRPQRDRVLERLAMTPNDARAFSSLDSAVGRTMRSLAEEWGCDPSNATWIVDRLVQRGWAERRAQEGDRRVKLVALTPNGVRTKTAFLRAMREAPRELTALPRAQLERLERAVRVLTGGGEV
jgi:DNA-binding MarR family transcriptional regulator